MGGRVFRMETMEEVHDEEAKDAVVNDNEMKGIRSVYLDGGQHIDDVNIDDEESKMLRSVYQGTFRNNSKVHPDVVKRLAYLHKVIDDTGRMDGGEMDVEQLRLLRLYKEKGAAMNDDIINEAEKTLTKKLNFQQNILDGDVTETVQHDIVNDEQDEEEIFETETTECAEDTITEVPEEEQNTSTAIREYSKKNKELWEKGLKKKNVNGRGGKLRRKSTRTNIMGAKHGSSKNKLTKPSTPAKAREKLDTPEIVQKSPRAKKPVLSSARKQELDEKDNIRKSSPSVAINDDKKLDIVAATESTLVDIGYARLPSIMNSRTSSEQELNNIENDLKKLSTKSRVESQYIRPVNMKGSRLSMQSDDDGDKGIPRSSSVVMNRQSTRLKQRTRVNGLFQKTAKMVLRKSNLSTSSRDTDDDDEGGEGDEQVYTGSDIHEERKRQAEKADQILRSDDYDEDLDPRPQWGKAWKHALTKLDLLPSATNNVGDISDNEQKMKELLDNISQEIDDKKGLVLPFN